MALRDTLGAALGSLGARISGTAAAVPAPAVGAPRPPPHPYDAPRRGKLDADAGARDLGLHVDSWQNLTTGMGDPSRDKLLGGHFMPLVQLDYGQIESLYYGDDMAERIVDALPDEAFRRGFELEGPEAEKAKQVLKDLDATAKLRDALGWARLWGGAAMILGIDDGQTQDKPLDVTRVRSVKFINVVDRRYVNPVTYYENALGPDFGLPETYQVTPAFGGGSIGGSGVIVHESRLIKLYGTRIDQITTRRLAGWSYSVLQRPYDVLRLFASAFQAAGQLANDAGQAVFEVSNLITQMSGPNRNAILQRFANLDMQRWAGRMLLVDKEKEGFRREPVQVAGVADLLGHFEMRLAAAARMPVTLLMGRSPAGLNATGESDSQQWHASVKAAQSNTLTPALTRLLDIVTAGEWSTDEDNKAVWSGMEEPNDKEEAEVEKLEADTWKIYSDMGAISGEQVALVKFANKPIAEVIDEDALAAVIEDDYELAKNPPPPPPGLVPGVPGIAPGAPPPPPGAPPGAPPPPPGAPPDGQDRGSEPPAEAGETAPDSTRS